VHGLRYTQKNSTDTVVPIAAIQVCQCYPWYTHSQPTAAVAIAVMQLQLVQSFVSVLCFTSCLLLRDLINIAALMLLITVVSLTMLVYTAATGASVVMMLCSPHVLLLLRTPQALTSVEQLERFLPSLKDLDKTSIWFSLVSGYLPVIALLGLINALPFLFQAIADKYEVSVTCMKQRWSTTASSTTAVSTGVDERALCCTSSICTAGTQAGCM
jgi:hypothetical protein